MTRDFTFVLTAANQWYNLWNDLITKDSSYDATASYGPFVPSAVCELKFQNQVPGVNIYRSDSKLESGFLLTGGSWDVDRADRNSIDLKNNNFKSDTAGAKLYVKITSN
jgi:hypothetical protein